MVIRWALWLLVVAWCVPAVAQDTATTADVVRSNDQNTSDTLAKISYGLETAFRSGHSDRGFLISDRPVFQPDAWLSLRGTEISLWSNFALADATDGTRPDIVEGELTHIYRWKRLSIGPAARMYFYDDLVNRSTDRSLEGWLNLSIAFGPLSLFTKHSVDLLDYRGGYYGEAGLHYDQKVTSGLEIGGSLGGGWANATFNAYWAGVAKSAFDRVSAESWLFIYPERHLYIGPHVELSSIVDRDVRAGDLFSPRYLLFTLTTGVEF